MRKESAIAESIGALMLIALLVAVVGIIIVVVVSWYPVWVVPDTSIKMYNESYTHGINTFYIQNTGGQTFKAGTYYLRVYDSVGNELPVGYYPDTDFTPGTTLLYSRTAFPGGEFSGEYGNVQVIYHKPESGELVIEGGAKQSRGTDVLMYQWTPVPTQGGSGPGREVQVSIFVLGPNGYMVYATTPLQSNVPCRAEEIFNLLPLPGYRPAPFSAGGTLSLVTSDGSEYQIRGYYTSGEIPRDTAASTFHSWSSFSLVPGIPYSSQIPESRTYVLEFVQSSGHTVRVFNGGEAGSGSVSVGGTPVPAGEYRDILVDNGNSFSLGITGTADSQIGDLKVLAEKVSEYPSDDLLKVTTTGNQVPDAIGQLTYTYTINSVTQDYLIYVDFEGTDETNIQAFVNQYGIIKGYDTSGNQMIVDNDQNGLFINKPISTQGYVIGSVPAVIESAWRVPGTGFPTIEAALNAPGKTLITGAIGRSSYVFSDEEIPDDGDYTIVVVYTPPEETVTTKIFNDGDLGVITVITPGGSIQVQPGESREIFTGPGDEITIQVNGNSYPISDFRWMNGLAATASVVFENGTQITGINYGTDETYSSTFVPDYSERSYAISFGTTSHQVQVWNGGEESITILGVEILPGESHYFPVGDGYPFSFLIDEGTGYRIQDLKELAGTTTETLFEAISGGTTIGGAVGQNTYTYSPPGGVVTQDYSITIIMEPVYTVQIFRDGPGDVLLNGVVMPADQTSFTLSGSDILTFSGDNTNTFVNAWVTNALVAKNEVPQDPDHTIVAGYNGAPYPYAIPNTENSITVDDSAQSDYTVYVQFYEESGRIIEAFVQGPGFVTDGVSRVSEYTEDRILYNEPILAVGQSFGAEAATIEYILLAPGTGYTSYDDALAAAQAPGGMVLPGAGTNSYPYTITGIPPEGDYTLVVKYLAPDEYNTIRIFNDGDIGTITGTTPRDGTVTIQPGQSFNFTALKGVDDITITIDGNEYAIDDFRRMNGLADSANEVFANGNLISGAIGQTSYATSESTITGSPIINDVSYAVSFTPTGYTVRVYHEGTGGTITVGGIEIPAGEYRDIPVGAGDPFALDIDGGTNSQIGDLKVLGGVISDDPDLVITTGDPVTDAIGDVTYHYTIDPVTKNYTIVVFMNPMYTIISTACQGGTITPAGTDQYPAGAEPEYVIAATDKNRIYQIYLDGELLPFDSVSRTYTYTFEPLDADHTIHAVFAIHGVRGNYWGNAYINIFDSTPGHADMTRSVRSGSRSGPPIESTTAWNQQIHDHIEFADSRGMTDHNTHWPSSTQYGEYPKYTTIDTRWPNRMGVYPNEVGQQTDKELFYVNWTGLMFLDQPGSYTFWTRDDDGMKVFVDGTMRTVDARAWVKPNPPDWADYYSFTVNTNIIGPGWHDYTIWHYDNYVHAGAYLHYQKPGELQAKPKNNAQNLPDVPYFDELYYLVDCYP